MRRSASMSLARYPVNTVASYDGADTETILSDEKYFPAMANGFS